MKPLAVAIPTPAHAVASGAKTEHFLLFFVASLLVPNSLHYADVVQIFSFSEILFDTHVTRC
jgi:hypothetical protein